VIRIGLFEWMNRHRAALVTAIGYATAGVITITAFVYLTFPWHRLSEWIRVKIERAAALDISVENSRVHFPFTLVWSDVTVRQPGHLDRVLWSANQISLGWPVGAILGRRLDLEFTVKSLGGEAHGRLTARRTAQGTQYHLEATGKNIELAKVAGGLQLPSEEIEGEVLVNRFAHDWMNADFLQGQGLLTLEAKGVELKGLQAHFSRISGSVSLKGGMGNLENFTAQGDALDLVGGGSLLLRPDVMESLLNFSSRVTLRKPAGPLTLLSAMASPDGHLDFALRGPLGHPTPYVNGTPFGSINIGGSKSPNGAEREAMPARKSTLESHDAGFAFYHGRFAAPGSGAGALDRISVRSGGREL
jgi:type II secretion system protein N